MIDNRRGMQVIAERYLAPQLTVAQAKRLDIVSAFEDKFTSGQWFIDPETDKIKCHPVKLWDTPWDFVRMASDLKCSLYFDIFHHMGIVHHRCLSCWKVVVRPQNFHDLLGIRDTMHDNLFRWGMFGKIGIEMRPYVSGHYNAFFYFNSKIDGLDGLKRLREEFSMAPAYLKRGCTEYELSLGEGPRDMTAPDPYNRDPGSVHAIAALESALDRKSFYETNSFTQPRFAKIRVYRKWLDWAAKHDPDRVEIHFGDHPFSQCQHIEE